MCIISVYNRGVHSTRISTNSSLIDNLFVNKEGITNYASILDDEISDHQVITININLISPKNETKYITICANSEECKSNFKNDIASKNIVDRLNKDLHADPNANYKILESEIISSMNCHMEKKIVKYNRKKHKRDPWITYGILKSVNKKKLAIQKIEEN